MKKFLTSFLSVVILSSFVLSASVLAAGESATVDIRTETEAATAFDVYVKNNDGILDKNYFFGINFPYGQAWYEEFNEIRLVLSTDNSSTIDTHIGIFMRNVDFGEGVSTGVFGVFDMNDSVDMLANECAIDENGKEITMLSAAMIEKTACTMYDLFYEDLKFFLALKDTSQITTKTDVKVEIVGVTGETRKVLDGATYTFSPLMSTEADGGYYTETEDADSTKQNGDVAFRTFFEKFADYSITKYGIYVYKTSTGTGKTIEGETALTTSNGYYTGTVTDVPLNATVYAKPYAVIGEKTYYGEMVNTTLTEASKWLGVKEAE